jgi:hypothetical protein
LGNTRPNKLKDIADELGEPLETLIPRIVQEEGAVHRAAVRLGVAPNSINNWLKKHGYRPVTTMTVTWAKEA